MIAWKGLWHESRLARAREERVEEKRLVEAEVRELEEMHRMAIESTKQDHSRALAEMEDQRRLAHEVLEAERKRHEQLIEEKIKDEEGGPNISALRRIFWKGLSSHSSSELLPATSGAITGLRLLCRNLLAATVDLRQAIYKFSDLRFSFCREE